MVETMDLSTTATPPGVNAQVIAGTEGGVALPASTAVLMNQRIGRRYRGGHPRIYLPFFNMSDLNAPQKWQTSSITALQTAWGTFLTSILNVAAPGPTCDFVANVSYYSNRSLRPTPLVDTVLSHVINPIPASQRRRMGR
jgi:hypothetical protein